MSTLVGEDAETIQTAGMPRIDTQCGSKDVFCLSEAAIGVEREPDVEELVG
jgi:hypothetical protein